MARVAVAGGAIAVLLVVAIMLAGPAPPDQLSPHLETLGSPADFPSPSVPGAASRTPPATTDATTDVPSRPTPAMPAVPSQPSHTMSAEPGPLLNRVHGRVLDDLGQALTGVSLQLRWSPEWSPGQPRVRRDIRAVTSDAQGLFEFVGLTAGPWALSGQDQPYSAERVELELTAEALDRDVLLMFPRPASVRGQVNDALGQPDAGRTVQARLISDRRAFFRSVTTDGQGRFQMNSLWPGSYELSFKIWETTVLPVPMAAAIQLAPATERFVELRVPAPGGLTGRVLFQGRPVPQSKVSFNGEHSTATAETDADGVYELSIPMSDSGHLIAVRREVAMTPWTQVEIVSGFTKTLDLRFQGVVLSGRVLDAVTQEPVPDVLVTFDALVEGQSRSKTFTRRTNQAGHFSALHLYPALWRLTPSQRRFLKAEPTDVAVPEGGLADLTLLLTKGATLRVVLRDADGESTTERLTLFLLPRDHAEPSPHRFTSAMGVFALTGQLAGDYKLIVVDVEHPLFMVDWPRLEEQALARVDVQLVEGETVQLDVTLDR